MKQKTYHFFDLNDLNTILQTINGCREYSESSGVLIQVYNPRLDIDEEAMIEAINKALPKACVSGITAANIAGKKYDISDYPVEISATYFMNTSIIQYDFNFEDVTSFVAGRIMNESIDFLKNVKCLQVFYNSTSNSICTFMREFNHHNHPVFGVKAGRSITRANTAHVYGRHVYTSGAVVIAFMSDCLKLYMDNNLGWHPIGRKMTITKTEGDTIIAEIDKKPAIDIYSKYLKVHPNKYFVENVCEFPLIIDRNGLKIARVPAGYDENGSILFTSEIQKGDHFRLSYATEEQLFALTQQSAEDLKAFSPDAIYIFECGNRLRFLNKDYSYEMEQYQKIGIELSIVSGYAELFVINEELGSDLNSTLVAIGLKEDSNGSDVIIPSRIPTVIEEPATNTVNKEIPFVERILAFLESTSQELDAMNKELGKIAYTDQLTKIYNRWELGRKIDESLELNRQGKPYGILFMDIDHFKHINDEYGHDVGDTVLLAVVNLIREKQKHGHAFGRWGGEEFVYLVPDVDEEGLKAFAEDIRKTIDDICFLTIKHLTISVGATLARTDDTLETFVKRADEAVYEAKETGRNKVCIH